MYDRNVGQHHISSRGHMLIEFAALMRLERVHLRVPEGIEGIVLHG